MAEKFYSILTNIGKAKVANSIGLGTKVNFKTMKVGDGNGSYYEPTENQTDLKNVVWEGNINHVTVDEKNPNWIHIEVMIPSTVGGFTIREYGAYDNEGDLIGICKCAETYKPVIADGSTKELLLDLILCVVNTDTVELKVDPTIIFAKKGEVEQLRTDITAQLKDIANKQTKLENAVANIDLNATKVNLNAINGMSAKNVQAGMQELFTFASNGKSAIAGVVGNVTGNNTHTEISNRIQADKNAMANNLNNKGVGANGNEALASLVSKIGNISIEGMGGKKFATGKVKGSPKGVQKDFVEDEGKVSTNKLNFLQINLSFKPKHIFAYKADYFSCAIHNGNLAIFGHARPLSSSSNFGYVSGTILEGNTIYLPIITPGIEELEFDYIAYE